MLAKVLAAKRALGKIWVDGGYQAGVAAWAAAEVGYAPEVVARPAGSTGFAVSPWRWVVERNFSWIERYRRLRKDYETLTTTSEAMIWAAPTAAMLRRLAKRGASSTPSKGLSNLHVILIDATHPGSIPGWFPGAEIFRRRSE